MLAIETLNAKFYWERTSRLSL